MKIVLNLLMIAVLALFAAGAGSDGSAMAGSVLDTAAADQVGVEMADCDDCTAEQMQAGAQTCGPVCVPPAVTVVGAQGFQHASEPVARFPATDDDLAGQVRPPEPSPPRIS